jgi:hypothetical protein
VHSKDYNFCSGISSTGRLQHASVRKRMNLHQCRDIVGSLGSLKPRRENSYPTTHKSQQWPQLQGAEGPTLLYNPRSATDKASALLPQYSQVNLTSEGYYLQILDLDFRPGCCKWRQHLPTGASIFPTKLAWGPGAFKSAPCQHF